MLVRATKSNSPAWKSTVQHVIPDGVQGAEGYDGKRRMPVAVLLDHARIRAESIKGCLRVRQRRDVIYSIPWVTISTEARTM